MVSEPFAPLPGRGRGRRPAAAAKTDAWRVIHPVPDDAPPPPQQHYRHGKPARTETYRDPDGRVFGYVWRFDLADGGKEFAPLTLCENGAGRREWRWKAWPEPRPLYGLDRLAQRPQAPVVICAGEKAADAAGELLPDFVAVTSPNGSQNARKADWSKLAGRTVTIWPDADKSGATYAETVAALLAPIAASVKRLTPPAGVKVGWDAADALAGGWNQARAAAFVGAATEQQPTPERQRRPRQSENLLELIADAELWHSPDREAFASIAINSHIGNWPVRSKSFRLWALGRYYEATGTAPGGQALEDALRVIEARAIFEGAEHTPALRIGEHQGDLYLDLADEQWRAVRVRGNPQGWEPVGRAPVKFIRSNAMQPLPLPERGGSVEDLHDLLNVETEGDFKLAIAKLVGDFHPRGPYVILALNGEQGSSKSTVTRLLRYLIDPNTAPIRSAPRDEQTLIIQAQNSWVVALDNLSDLPGWLSDALCRLATGGGFSQRELFTDYGEIVFHVTRPVILNGIPDLASRPDLADRAIHLTLPAIDEDARRSEEDFWADVEARRPRILGALLDGVAGALHHRGELPPTLTRMADFVAWVSGAEKALGWYPGEFLKAYVRNREGAVDTTIENDPIGLPIQMLIEDAAAGRLKPSRDPDGKEREWPPCYWEGTPTALLEELATRVPEAVRKSRIWPSVTKLRSRLRRLQAPLRTKGIILDLNFRGPAPQHDRLIVVRSADRPDDTAPPF
jgi:putative DNA primase/helicase